MRSRDFVYFAVKHGSAEKKPVPLSKSCKVTIRGTSLQWILNTYAPVAFPSGCMMMADDTVAASGLSSRTIVRSLLDHLLARQGFDISSFELKKHKPGKPFGIIGDKTVGVSISHCRSLLVCALHAGGEIGIDVEPCGRQIHPRLLDRICHPEEQSGLTEDLCCIRMWTIKEAALKFMGTGLRMSMNKIKLDMTGEHLFRANMGPEKILISSFTFRDHWVAMATDAPPLPSPKK